jgi:hypothetical protein
VASSIYSYSHVSIEFRIANLRQSDAIQASPEERNLGLDDRKIATVRQLPKDWGCMDIEKYCAYNRTRECFLSQEVIGADGALDPLAVLRVLIEGLALNAKSGFWLKHLVDIPSVPRLSPFDLVYLDRDHWVIQGVEVLPGVEIPPLSRQVASALVLPLHTITSTQTNPGDRLVVCLEEEMKRHLALVSGSATIGQVAQIAERMEERSRGSGSSDYSNRPSEAANEELPGKTPRPLGFQPVTIVPAAPHRTTPQEKSRTPHISNSITPAPVGQNIEFTLAQSPIWRISSPNVSTSVPKTKKNPEGAFPSFHSSNAFNGFKHSNGFESLLGEKHLGEKRPPEKLPLLSMSAPTNPVQADREPSPLLKDPVPTEVNLTSGVPLVPTPENNETRADGHKIPRISSLAAPVPPSGITAHVDGVPPTAANEDTVRLGLIEKLRPAMDRLTPKKLSKALTQRKFRLTIPSPAWLGNEPLKRLKDEFLNWLNDEPVTSDRRRTPRSIAKGLVAYYWTGGAPKGHKISDISATGFYMQTEDRWVPDTMLQMTLQRIPAKDGRPRQSIAVLTRVVRKGVDGVGHEFVMTEAFDRGSRDILPAGGTDRVALERFL